MGRPSGTVGAGNQGGADLRIQWHEIDAIVNAGPGDRVYEVRQDDEQHTIVRFGDGVNGARLPTGYGNVVATYRWGDGRADRVEHAQLTLLPSRPRGITAVINPIPSSGGTEPEGLVDTRRAAPRSSRSNGRVASMKDYELFAEAFPGIEHATASRITGGRGDVIHVSVATRDGSDLDPGAPTLAKLDRALTERAAVPFPHVVQAAEWSWLTICAALVVDARYDADDVIKQATEVLNVAFSAATATFATDVAAADVTTLLQSQIGVIGVELRRFATTTDSPGVRPIVRSPGARWDPISAAFQPAVLIAARSGDVHITVAELSS